MKITFVGLSCYLIEDSRGGRLLIDVFKDAPEYSFGLNLPDNLRADIFLASHADADHANLDEKFVEHKLQNDTRNSTEIIIFPDMNLRGTLVKEWNGDLCIAYHFTVDGLRCLHLADNSHSLTEKQITEIGQIAILFLPMSKSKSDAIALELEIIDKLKPKIIIPAHIIPLPLGEIREGYDSINAKLGKIILPATKNPNADENTVAVFSHMLLVAENLTKNFATNELRTSSVEINELPSEPTIYYFDECLAKPE